MLNHCFSALALLAAASVCAEAATPTARFPQQSQGQLALAAEPEVREKRYVAALARNGDLPFTVHREWHKKLHPAVSAHRGLQAALAPSANALGIPGKRYVGSLARMGQMPGKRDVEEEMTDVIDDQMEQLLFDEMATAKELQADERNLEKLQKIQDELTLEGNLNGQNLQDDDEDVKRGISTLAKNGQLPAPLTPGDNRSEDADDVSAERKRGGVSALARLGYLPPHKKNLDWLLSMMEEQRQMHAPENKRNIGALARDSGLPTPGKRNLGSLARGGGFSALRQPQQLSTGKRLKEENEFNGGNMDFPRYDLLDSFHDIREFNKRYVAALLRHGRLPVGDGSLFGARFDSQDDRSSSHEDDAISEEKRHIGALRRLSKRSTDFDEASAMRVKRQAEPYPSDEVLLPVYQTNDQIDDDNSLLQGMMMANDASGPDKRFLGRIPQMSRSRPRAQMQAASVRRDRPRSRNI